MDSRNLSRHDDSARQPTHRSSNGWVAVQRYYHYPPVGIESQDQERFSLDIATPTTSHQTLDTSEIIAIVRQRDRNEPWDAIGHVEAPRTPGANWQDPRRRDNRYGTNGYQFQAYGQGDRTHQQGTGNYQQAHGASSYQQDHSNVPHRQDQYNDPYQQAYGGDAYPQAYGNQSSGSDQPQHGSYQTEHGYSSPRPERERRRKYQRRA